MNQSKKDLFTERAAKALEGIEMLLAMWIEKSVPAGEIWVGEGPDKELSRKAWRPSDSTPLIPFEETQEPSRIVDRIEHIEERLNRLTSDLATLEARVHEEQPE